MEQKRIANMQLNHLGVIISNLKLCGIYSHHLHRVLLLVLCIFSPHNDYSCLVYFWTYSVFKPRLFRLVIRRLDNPHGHE